MFQAANPQQPGSTAFLEFNEHVDIALGPKFEAQRRPIYGQAFYASSAAQGCELVFLNGNLRVHPLPSVATSHNQDIS